MKAYEILNEFSGAEKRPAGIVGQGLKRVGAAVLGAAGAKNVAGALSGSADVGARANAYNKEFAKYLKQQGKPLDDVEYVDLNQFIDNMGLPKIKLPANGWVADGDLGNIFKDIAELSLGKGQGAASRAEPTGSTSAKPEQPDSKTNTATKIEPTLSTPDNADSTATTKSSSNPFSNPQELLSAFQEYADADGKFTPALRKAVRSIWMQMGGTKIESKQHQKKGI